MKLLVVIVNYRTPAMTIDCLATVVPQLSPLPGSWIVVTDNGSGDGSAERLRQAVIDRGWQDRVTIQPLPRNGGFAYGNNEGIRPFLASATPPAYVLLLNPDTLVFPGAIEALLGFMDVNKGVGIAGSRLEHRDGTPQRSAFRFHSVWSELEHGLRFGPVSKALARRIVAPEVPTFAGPTDWVCGASMMIRKEVFDAVGLLDEQYFMYFEETDFCLAARRAGHATWYVPESRVVHLVGQASGVTDTQAAVRKRRPAYWFESRKRFFRKNHGWFAAKLADVAWAGGYGVYRLRQLVQRKPETDPPRLLWDFVRHNFLGAKG